MGCEVMNDQVEKIKELQRKHEELLKKIRERGYDVDNLPSLTEQERDEFDMVRHNANRSGKFDWGMRDVNASERPVIFTQIVLAASAIIPLCLAGYLLIEGDGILRLLVPAFVMVCLAHMYYGFRWAKYAVALTSVIPVYAQLLMLGGLQAALKYFVFFVLSAITINSYLLLKSKSVAQFLGRQRAFLSDSKLHKLRLLRLTIAILFIGAIAADVARLVFE